MTKIHEDKCVYPIIVTWDDTNVPFMEDVSSFTEDGCLSQYFDNDSTVLKVVDKESTKKEKKSMAEDKKFKVGDHVWSPHFGAGIVTETEADSGAEYPIKVEWGHSGELCTYDYFTKDGQFDISGCNPDMAIYSVEPEHAAKVIPNLSNELTKKPEEDEGIVEQMEDALNKKTEDAITLVEKALPKKDDAINPSHYRVKGIPEAIHLMTQLMTKEQIEGFLWGNIIKYSYRYGRKGDKKETAGKIEWYAQKLKELGECESK